MTVPLLHLDGFYVTIKDICDTSGDILNGSNIWITLCQPSTRYHVMEIQVFSTLQSTCQELNPSKPLIAKPPPQTILSFPFQREPLMRSSQEILISFSSHGNIFPQFPLLLNKFGFTKNHPFSPLPASFILIRYLNILPDFINLSIPLRKKLSKDNMA